MAAILDNAGIESIIAQSLLDSANLDSQVTAMPSLFSDNANYINYLVTLTSRKFNSKFYAQVLQ